jgi:two-component system response regulator FlrC
MTMPDPHKTAPAPGSDTAQPRCIVSQSESMRQLLEISARVSQSDATILIQGESGTGKELLARHLHANSRRNSHPLVAMNCAALPEQLVESELFGYERGAFTGAVGKRRGRFELAHQGTLLLDEISEMPLLLQAKLLRVLQEREIDPVGGNRPIPVDVRVIATTNKNLSEMVKDGRFREDLYYRLRVVPLTIPPLRKRPDDIPLLAEFFIEKHGPANGKNNARFTERAMEMLCAHPWPGNVRELENTVLRALLICPEEMLDGQHLLLEMATRTATGTAAHSLVGLTVDAVEKELIRQTLTHVNQNRTHAAKMLGISIRTLRNKLNAYNSSPERLADSAPGQ